jgi:NAD(P)-dependent dehydrogenase (short-subunit alcohol dehydrogenase family)
MTRLQGKRALITGGNAGLGLATAARFIEEGAQVCITGRNPETLAAAAAQLGPNCLPLRADVTRLEQLDSAIAEIQKQFGGLDIVFANAGVLYATPLGATDVARFDEMLAINIRGVFFTIDKALPLMAAGGSIILNSSVARHIGATKVACYAATKGAVHAMTKSLAADLAPRGIRVNAVCPGPIDTEMWQGLARLRKGAVHINSQIPLGRIGEPHEIASVVAFLASSDSSLMTGTELIADGGRVEASHGAAIYS